MDLSAIPSSNTMDTPNSDENVPDILPQIGTELSVQQQFAIFEMQIKQHTEQIGT